MNNVMSLGATADMCKVPLENVRIISREECEEADEELEVSLKE